MAQNSKGSEQDGKGPNKDGSYCVCLTHPHLIHGPLFQVLEAVKVPCQNTGANKRVYTDKESLFSCVGKRMRNPAGDHVESGSTSALPSANSQIQESNNTPKVSSVCKTMLPSPTPPPIITPQQSSGTPGPISSPVELQGLAVSQQDNTILGKPGKEELGAMALNSGLQATFFTRLLWDQFKLREKMVSKKASELDAAEKIVIDLENQLGTRIDELEAAKKRITLLEAANKRVTDLENQLETQFDKLEAAKQRNTELEERLRNDRIWNHYREAKLYQKYEFELKSVLVALNAEKVKVAELKKSNTR